ncbi:formyltransferase family protein [Oceanimonas doudoroffii]|uniref:Methionyl-tRNA formyltransferase n=1 Tax=Oceanimonas doudoroffii TaxID=84158 RepID=A0A233RFE3_9GAMM|nr:formyltransferase family protein [Oceanimonas doudoroffii]OXY82111.1 hypothetical protein B6S08_00820 [Oceanimonas doudoroffii]
MMKIGFYIMGFKGLSVLNSFINHFGCKHIAYVVTDEDTSVTNDHYNEILSLCSSSNIQVSKRKNTSSLPDVSYKFAIGWRWLINESDNLIVLHDSLLPRYRGFAPLVNMLVNGEKEIGVTALLANEDYDRGDIIGQKSIKITYPIKISDAINKISYIYSELVIFVFTSLLTGKLKPKQQQESDSTYSIWLDEEDYFINWKWKAEKIKRFVDAVGYPYGRARTKLNTQVLMIDDVEVTEDVQVEDRERHIGKVIFMKNRNPIVICGEGLLELTSIDFSESNLSKVNFRSRFK